MTNELREIDKVRAERDALARHLFTVLYDLHPTYGSTTGPYGGIGGQALTQWCHVKDPYTTEHDEAFHAADDALREQVRRAEREGYSLLEEE